MREAINKYITTVIWCSMNFNNPEVQPAVYANMLERLERFEDSLRNLGVTNRAIGLLCDYAWKIMREPTQAEAVKLAQIIFQPKSVETVPANKA